MWLVGSRARSLSEGGTLPRLHRSMPKIARMPAEGLVQQVRRMPTRCFRQSTLEIVFQRRAEVWVGAFLDDEAGALAWRQTPKVGKSLLRHDDLDVMLCVVHVGDHGHDARNCSSFGN